MIDTVTAGRGAKRVSIQLDRGFDARRAMGKALKQNLFPGKAWDAAKARGAVALAGVA
jgi:hypothetical protein